MTAEDRTEVARLYRDTDASVRDIRERFGLASDSYIYRVLQEHQIPLRSAKTDFRPGRRTRRRPAAMSRDHQVPSQPVWTVICLVTTEEVVTAETIDEALAEVRSRYPEGTVVISVVRQ